MYTAPIVGLHARPLNASLPHVPEIVNYPDDGNSARFCRRSRIRVYLFITCDHYASHRLTLPYTSPLLVAARIA